MKISISENVLSINRGEKNEKKKAFSFFYLDVFAILPGARLY